MKKQGVLIYDDVIGRMDIRCGPLDYYTGIPRDEVRKAILAQMGVPENASLPRQKSKETESVAVCQGGVGQNNFIKEHIPLKGRCRL